MSDQFDWIDLERYLAALSPSIGTIRPEWITPGSMPSWVTENAAVLSQRFETPLPFDDQSQPWAAIWFVTPRQKFVIVSPQNEDNIGCFNASPRDGKLSFSKGIFHNGDIRAIACALAWRSLRQREMICTLSVWRDEAEIPTFDDLVARRYVMRPSIECAAELTATRLLAALHKHGRLSAYQVSDEAGILDRILETVFGIPVVNVDIGSLKS